MSVVELNIVLNSFPKIIKVEDLSSSNLFTIVETVHEIIFIFRAKTDDCVDSKLFSHYDL